MDALLTAADTALRTLFAKPRATQAYVGLPEHTKPPDAADCQRSAALMRVNHAGEVCAQALYTAQALASKNEALRAHFMRACEEESEHLAWTAQRLRELGSHPSVLNPLWYAGAFGIGLLAGSLGDAISLGFVEETEVQVGEHLQSHLQALPDGDHVSRAIVAQMHADELRHAHDARVAGAADLPQPIKDLMRMAAKVMTTVVQRGG